jgi:hypothetical protein
MLTTPSFTADNALNAFAFVEYNTTAEAYRAAASEKWLWGTKLRVEPKEYSARRENRMRNNMETPGGIGDWAGGNVVGYGTHANPAAGGVGNWGYLLPPQHMSPAWSGPYNPHHAPPHPHQQMHMQSWGSGPIMPTPPTGPRSMMMGGGGGGQGQQQQQMGFFSPTPQGHMAHMTHMGYAYAPNPGMSFAAPMQENPGMRTIFEQEEEF